MASGWELVLVLGKGLVRYLLVGLSWRDDWRHGVVHRSRGWGYKELGYARVGDIERPNNQLYMDRAWRNEVDSCVALYFKYCIGGAVPTGNAL